LSHGPSGPPAPRLGNLPCFSDNPGMSKPSKPGSADPTGGWSEDWAQVWTDSGAGQPLPAALALTAKRREVDQAVLSNLLRLNQARCDHNKGE
jgi:hypothetical protein